MALYDDDGYGGYAEWLWLEWEWERKSEVYRDERQRVEAKRRRETGGERKSVCFVSDCAAMIDDAVNGILLETLWRVNRQRAGWIITLLRRYLLGLLDDVVSPGAIIRMLEPRLGLRLYLLLDRMDIVRCPVPYE